MQFSCRAFQILYFSRETATWKEKNKKKYLIKNSIMDITIEKQEEYMKIVQSIHLEIMLFALAK